MSNIKVIFQKLPASELDFQEIDHNFSFTTIKSSLLNNKKNQISGTISLLFYLKIILVNEDQSRY